MKFLVIILSLVSLCGTRLSGADRDGWIRPADADDLDQ
jgi:hypothetical protein